MSTDNDLRQLRSILNEWDPVGVADVVSDEYECLIDPLIRLMNEDLNREAVANFLISQLVTHFELNPADYDVPEVAAKIVSWRRGQPTDR
jgi:hypothetical protein